MTRRLRRAVRTLLAERRARKTYRQLCDQGRAPLVSVSIRLEMDHGDDWSHFTVRGMTGLKTGAIPLTPRGERYIASIAAGIRRTCISELIAMQQQDQETR